MGFDFNKFKAAMLQKDNLQKSIAQKQNLLSQLTGTVNKLKNAVQVATAYPTQPSTVTMNLPNGTNLATSATNQNVVLKTNSNYTAMMNVINGFIQVHTPYKMACWNLFRKWENGTFWWKYIWSWYCKSLF